MSSALFVRDYAIYQESATDLSSAIGKTVIFTAGAPVVSSSATVKSIGIVLDARTKSNVVNGVTNTTYLNSIGILGGFPGTCRGSISATQATPITFGTLLAQYSDGTLVSDPGSGARVIVGVMCDPNGAVAGDLCEIAACEATYYAS
jgi:hypothetical protein